MPRRLPDRIKNDFSAYHRFLSDKKTVEHQKVKMAKHANKNKFTGKSSIAYAVIQGDKWFEAEISIEDRKAYRLKLFANYFDDGPCFRFDSKGRGHCNPETGRGLKKRQVLTPHFHKFNEQENVEIAYKTAKLNEDSESKRIVGDYKCGLEHFCQEAKLLCDHSVYPELEIDQDELDLSSDDPQNGVSF